MKVRAIAGAAVIALALGACSSDSSESVPTSTSAAGGDEFPVAIATANGDVTITERPESIVSLSPTATEMLFAIGAGDQVVAVDEFSDYPPEAPTTELSGYTPNVEAIVGFEPDLVVASNGIEGIEVIDAPLVVLPAAVVFDDVYSQIERLGAATGHVAEAAELVMQMQSDIDEIVAGVPVLVPPATYYHELERGYSVTSTTFIGEVYKLFGLENVADPADSDGFGYPAVSEEFLVEADPDFVFLADTKCCGESAETVAARDGWGAVSAVAEGNIVELDDDVASRWGPRVVDFVRSIAAALRASTG